MSRGQFRAIIRQTQNRKRSFSVSTEDDLFRDIVKEILVRQVRAELETVNQDDSYINLFPGLPDHGLAFLRGEESGGLRQADATALAASRRSLSWCAARKNGGTKKRTKRLSVFARHFSRCAPN